MPTVTRYSRRRRRTSGSQLVIALVLVAIAAGWYLTQVNPPVADAGDDAPATISTADARAALSELAELTIKGKSPLTGYDREGKFGDSWTDVDDNGCDTRNDILHRDLTSITAEGSCKVMTGTLVSPYTNETIAFQRGIDTSAEVQIDHVVALANAWQTGAQKIGQAQRVELANDPLNLFAVDGTSNSAKGAGDAATWLPASTTFRCTYVAHQVEVKRKYKLWVTRAEHDAIARVLQKCD